MNIERTQYIGHYDDERGTIIALLPRKLGDYKNNRYFKRRGFDVYLRYGERGCEGKASLTIDMLYQAIKAKRWDTQTLEAIGYQTS